ncbi:MAG: phosphoribosylanthranilate isomerase [Candidatus Tritonobacter lacicola]|nr:phosphoribosylanthranilate isomerase [Candidatus Tritonobacter lacicola]
MEADTVKVKICGITSVRDALATCELGADAIGLVFSGSPRKVSLNAAAEIAGRVSPFVTVVGVFVNEEREFVSRALEQCSLDLVQLHGDESPEYCLSFPGRVIKSFRIGEAGDISPVSSFSVRAALFDSRVRGAFGGTGKAFEWKVLGDVTRLQLSVILAGGLNADNVGRAIEIVRPYAVDVSSGVEAEPGKKDYARMKEFMQKVRHREKASG